MQEAASVAAFLPWSIAYRLTDSNGLDRQSKQRLPRSKPGQERPQRCYGMIPSMEVCCELRKLAVGSVHMLYLLDSLL